MYTAQFPACQQCRDISLLNTLLDLKNFTKQEEQSASLSEQTRLSTDLLRNEGRETRTFPPDHEALESAGSEASWRTIDRAQQHESRDQQYGNRTFTDPPLERSPEIHRSGFNPLLTPDKNLGSTISTPDNATHRLVLTRCRMRTGLGMVQKDMVYLQTVGKEVQRHQLTLLVPPGRSGE
ncbi:hypothetical protein HOLleu_25637 [Holothuria leucospilota]|uniref:Uncharacterized protein n=1 Tax=Holothuria leucospilota TaxID=206669 RepID=A0A9Q1BT59_HOLLE|nr:hypothetical protein HOLleu_25637 [Holothuria leucospilota]